MCKKTRLLDLIRNCIIFDAGRKKVPRVHQYIALKAAQERIRKKEGGVIWHTQGSGKSILMVMLAKWILEHDPEGRVLIITDRDELDKQIEGVMKNAGVVSEDSPSPRITTREAFERSLAATTPRLLCALVHKFNPDLKSPPPEIYGRFYIFVDECHRTQGGKMNRQMKQWIKNGIFIGFTGTPLLRRDKKTTREVFGTYIHTYKFHEAVADKVILDLKYEARAVPQHLSSRKKIDNWFRHKTKRLNKYQRAVLRKRWATMKELMSSADRKRRIVASIIEDFSFKPRLNNDRGNALLVAASIYDACHYFRILRGNNQFGPRCGIITSYQPNHNAISREPRDSDERYKFDTYTQYVLKKGQPTKDYEDKIKHKFIREPANCKLLIVVSKLLTGFDAPSCTYLYLDNEIRDHTLFQAICRTNRLDGDDKDYGYIVDFKELYADLQHSIAVYTSEELDIDADGSTGNVKVKNWLEEGKKALDAAREALKYLCEPVGGDKSVEQYLIYFCGSAATPRGLEETEPLRMSFYKAVSTFLRAFAAIERDLDEAGYSKKEIVQLRKESVFYADIRDAIKKHSGEELDIKPYEADMRYLINTYIQADGTEKLGSLSSHSLTELIIETGIHNAIARKLNAKGTLSKNAIAEGIINNVRKTIIREQLTDPKFYKKISRLLDDLIMQQRNDAQSYKAFLKKAEDLVKKMAKKNTGGHPAILSGKPGAVVLFTNLDTICGEKFQCPADEDKRAELAIELDTVMKEKAPSGWKRDADGPKGKQILNAIYPVMSNDPEATMAVFEIIKNQPGY